MSGTNTDTISYFTIYMRHCTVSQPNEDEDKLVRGEYFCAYFWKTSAESVPGGA